MSKVEVKKLLKDSSVPDAKGQTDTIRVWEAYKDQAALWRAIALLQIPATAIALVMALIMWSSHKIVLNVPARPLPGTYAVGDIRDNEFVDIATEFVNLIATYQPQVARRQFERASQMIKEPLLSYFKTDMLVDELKAIETTGRTQIFFADPTKTKIVRDGQNVTVTFIGDRTKIIGGRDSPPQPTFYEVTLTTIPRNPLNPYGIVVINAAFDEKKRD